MRPLLLLFALPLWAADDVSAIIQRAIQAEHFNGPKAEQYTYVRRTEHFTIDKKGAAHLSNSEVHDILFVEGLAYEKLVARNDKPLSRREQAQVDKDMRLKAQERRKHMMRAPAGGVVHLHSLFSDRSLDLGSLGELLTLFDNRVVGEEELRGHKVWVIESTPAARHAPASEHERDVLSFRKKLWVDQTDGAPVRAKYTVSAVGSFLAAGSSLTFDSDKVDADTWQVIGLTVEFASGQQKVFQPTGRTVYSMTQFRKFDVQSTITVIPAGK